ncbi:hypothetical protein ACNOYE_13130 [Nannocystaceae bacterium ST9]
MPSQDSFAVRRSELERLSAVETLKGLSNPSEVKLAELVSYLEECGLWEQFSKITLGDLRDAFSKSETPAEADSPRKRKRRIFREAIAGSEGGGEAETEGNDAEIDALKTKPADGGMTTDEVARMVVPFVEGNGDVTLDDIAEYTRLDRKVLRHHLGVLCKEGRLERIGVGRHAIYSSVA